MTQPSDPRQVRVIVELIEHTRKIAETNNRDDLIGRLAAARDRITDPQIRVVIAGQLKQGKSQLLNSLLNMPVARVGDDESTVLTTVVLYGEQPAAQLIVATADGGVEAIAIPTADINKDLRRAPQAGGREVLRVEVIAPSPLLNGGLVFIDTPGVGGHGQPHLAATLGLLPDADAMLMVSDTSQEFTEPEMTFVRQAFEICPVAAIVATKTDLYPHWRAVVDADQTHLQRAGLTIPLIPASSLLRHHAISLDDKELNEESNFPAIVAFLSDKVLSRENDRVRDQVLAELLSTADHLTLTLESELSTLTDPDVRERLTADLERRKREAQDALAASALWQQVLNDGVADLTADVDHDLRSRFRAITQRFENVVDGCDPTLRWAEIGNELEQAVAEAVGDNFVWAFQRAEALAKEVARTFEEVGLEPVRAPQISARQMGAAFSGFKSLAQMDAKPVSASSKVVSGMRGSYGGVLMFGMLGSLAGLGMFNPLSVGAGLLLGRKAYKEDMENRMLRLRNEAKNNVRRFVDDISFVVTKESRDRLQAIHRQLRNHYREIANQTTRSLNESLQAMLTSARLEENERNQRAAELDRQLNVLKQVSAKAAELAAPQSAAAGTSPTQPRVTLRR
ncbi:MAG: dynamin-like GTPase family protein [Mycobacterium sp.]